MAGERVRRSAGEGEASALSKRAEPAAGTDDITKAVDRVPELTFDFTAKVEHILGHRTLFPELGALGCLFMVSAVESLSDTSPGESGKKAHPR